MCLPVNSAGILLCVYLLYSRCSGATGIHGGNVSVGEIDNPKTALSPSGVGPDRPKTKMPPSALTRATILGDDMGLMPSFAPTPARARPSRLEGRCLGHCTVVAVFSSRPVMREIVITPIRCG